MELAEQMGHNPTVCLGTYAHVMADLRGAPRTSAEEQIRAARGERPTSNVAQMWPKADSSNSRTRRNPRRRGKPSAGLEPATPSLPWKCSTN